MSGDFWLGTTLIVLLILANGFFSGAEIAVVSVRRSRIDQLAQQGQKSALIVARLKDDADRFLATVQIGVTLVGSLASALGGASAVAYLGPILQQSGIPFLREWAGVLAIGIAVVTISYLSLVLGELVPKSLALRYPEPIACAVARPLDLISRVFVVAVKLLTASSNLLLFLSGSGTKSTEVNNLPPLVSSLWKPNGSLYRFPFPSWAPVPHWGLPRKLGQIGAVAFVGPYPLHNKLYLPSSFAAPYRAPNRVQRTVTGRFQEALHPLDRQRTAAM